MCLTFSRRFIVKQILFVVFIISLCISAPSFLHAKTQPQTAIEPDIENILQRGILRIGIYHKDKPPFIMTQKDGSLYGIDIDLANKIGQKLGVDVEFDRTSKSYSELIERVSKGQDFDLVICKMSSTMNRARKVRFSKPYLIFHQGLALNKRFLSANKIKSDYPIAGLREMQFKVGVRVATSYVEYAKNLFPKAEIVEGEWKEIVEKLLIGELDALMRDEYTLMTMVKKNPDIALRLNIYRIKDRKDPIAIAAPVKNSMLQYWLNLYLDSYFPLPMTSDDLIVDYPELWQK